jgi:hypothetical protein
LLSQAIDAMLQRLDDFLPPPGNPPPTVSLVSAEEKPIGLGDWRGTAAADDFYRALKGIRVAATVRFQVWDGGAAPTNAEAAISDLCEQLLAEKDTLEAEGFLKLQLKSVAVSEHITSASAWRQTAEFEVLYEFHFQPNDDAGGLIARMPLGWAQSFGDEVISGDIVLWNEIETPALIMTGMRPVGGLGALHFLPGPPVAGTVTVTRTFQGAAGAPVSFGNLADFLDAVSGPSPAQTHAQVQFAVLTDYLDALGTNGDAIPFVDENGSPRDFFPITFRFAQAIELPSRNDRLEVAFGGTTLGANQILYLRGIRGTTNPT